MDMKKIMKKVGWALLPSEFSAWFGPSQPASESKASSILTAVVGGASSLILVFFGFAFFIFIIAIIACEGKAADKTLAVGVFVVALVVVAGLLLKVSAAVRNASLKKSDDELTRVLLPTHLSPWAIAAGYLGLFSLIVLPGPLALWCGIKAIRDIRGNSQRHGMGRALLGVAMGGLATVVLICLVIWFVGRKIGRH